MTTAILETGDRLVIELNGMGGQYEIHFDTREYPQQFVIKQTENLFGEALGKHVPLLHANLKEVEEDVADEDFEDNVPEPVGFFMDAHNKIHCTALVSCRIRYLPSGIMTVVTLSAPDGEESEETGEFDFYPTIQDLERQLNQNGWPLQRPAI